MTLLCINVVLAEKAQHCLQDLPYGSVDCQIFFCQIHLSFSPTMMESGFPFNERLALIIKKNLTQLIRSFINHLTNRSPCIRYTLPLLLKRVNKKQKGPLTIVTTSNSPSWAKYNCDRLCIEFSCGSFAGRWGIKFISRSVRAQFLTTNTCPSPFPSYRCS